MNYTCLDTDELIALSIHDLQNNNYESSLLKLKSSLSRSDLPLIVNSLLGRIYAAVNLYEKSRFFLRKYIDSSENYSRLEMFELAIVERNMQNYDSAIEVFDVMVKTNPQDIEACFYAGEMCFELDRFYEAEKYLQNVIELADDNNDYFSVSSTMLHKIKTINSSQANGD